MSIRGYGVSLYSIDDWLKISSDLSGLMPGAEGAFDRAEEPEPMEWNATLPIKSVRPADWLELMAEEHRRAFEAVKAVEELVRMHRPIPSIFDKAKVPADVPGTRSTYMGFSFIRTFDGVRATKRGRL